MAVNDLIMLSAQYEHIRFLLHHHLTKTAVYRCCTNSSGDDLGEVRWYAPWRQYCFFPFTNTVFSKGCMEDINTFITKLMDDRAAVRRAK